MEDITKIQINLLAVKKHLNINIKTKSQPDFQNLSEIQILEILRDLDGNENLQIAPETERFYQSQEPLRVMDSKISEILEILRRHFSCSHDSRHIPGLKFRISCHLRFESEPFNHIWGDNSPTSQ